MSENGGHDLSPDGEDLPAKLREWLHGEGYPLEFATAEAFRKAGFGVRQGVYTEPTPTEPRREVDVTAEMTLDRNVGLRVKHVIECKWSGDKPWVMFCSRGHRITTDACVTQSIASSFAHLLLWKEAGNPRLKDLSLFATPESPAFGGRQAFGKRDVLFNAVSGVTGNCRLIADEYEIEGVYGGQSGLLPNAAVVTFPVIVVDGRLFEAHHGSGGLDLHEVTASRVHWRGAERHRFAHTTIDVVRADHLEQFAAQRAADSEALLDVLAAALEEVLARLTDGTLERLTITRGSRGVVGWPPLLRRLIDATRALTETGETTTRDVGAGTGGCDAS